MSDFVLNVSNVGPKGESARIGEKLPCKPSQGVPVARKLGSTQWIIPRSDYWVKAFVLLCRGRASMAARLAAVRAKSGRFALATGGDPFSCKYGYNLSMTTFQQN